MSCCGVPSATLGGFATRGVLHVSADVTQRVGNGNRVPLRQCEHIIFFLETPVLAVQSIVFLLQCLDTAFQRFDSCLAFVCHVVAGERATSTLPARPLLIALLIISPHHIPVSTAWHTYPHLSSSTRVAGDVSDGTPLGDPVIAWPAAGFRLPGLPGLFRWRHRAPRASEIDAAECRHHLGSKPQRLCHLGT